MSPGIPRCICGRVLSWIFGRYWCPNMVCKRYEGPGALGGPNQ